MEGFEYDGPPLAGQTLPVLPFPGSVTVTCTADSRQPETCVPKGQPGVSVLASGEIKVERTPTFLDMDGCPFQNLSIQTTLKLGANAEAKGAKIGGQLQAYLGQRLEVPDHGHAGQRRRHRGRPARRAEPASTRARSRRARRSSSTRTTSRASRPRAPIASSRSRWATTRAGGSRAASSAWTTRPMRVMVGDEDFVKQALKLGIKLGDVSALARQHEGAQRRQAPRDRHRHLDRGRLERLPALHRRRASCRSRARPARRTRRRPRPSATRTRRSSRPSSAGSRSAAAAPRPRALGLGREPRDGTTTHSTNVRYNDTSLAIVLRGGRQRQPDRHAAVLADAPRRARRPTSRCCTTASAPEAAGRRPAEGPPDRLHRGGAPRAAGARARRGSPTGCRVDRDERPTQRRDPRVDAGEPRHRRSTTARPYALTGPRVGARLGEGPRSRCWPRSTGPASTARTCVIEDLAQLVAG